MKHNTRVKSTVEIMSEAMEKVEKEQHYTPEQLQTLYFRYMVTILAALDDDMQELIKTLKSWDDDDEECELTAYWKYNPDTDLAECSNCGAHCPHDEIGRVETHYCPRCGAKMEGTS